MELLRLPARSPNLNAYAERFVGSIKSECLRHIVPIGERRSCRDFRWSDRRDAFHMPLAGDLE